MADTNNNAAIDFSSILASTVHDIKNSLSTVITTLDELTTELEETHTQNKKLNTLKYESKRINNQLIVLLTLYKFENKQYHLSINEHTVKDFIEEAVLPYTELLEQNNIQLSTDCDANLVWYFDENLVGGVINTIINNAYRYAKDRIMISAVIQNDYLVLSIADNGQGYPEDLLTSTTPGHQQGVSFQSGSTGLGLYFSQRIAELHKNKNRLGYTTIDNNGINQGGRFNLFIP